MTQSPDIPAYDVIVVGAGPAGAEAAMAAARAGARTLCLAINLDMAGFPPATPVLVENREDARARLLDEMNFCGGTLPGLLKQPDVAETDVTADDGMGRVVVDRRLLGLAYKSSLESTENLELRQALVTSLEPLSGSPATGWLVTTKLGERFGGRAVVIAAGTFLQGVVDDAGDLLHGGRLGEIPSNSLALWLKNLGIGFIEIHATSNPRVDGRSVAGAVFAGPDREPDGSQEPALAADGRQLGERIVRGMRPRGNRLDQMAQVRQSPGLAEAWMTRASFKVFHQALRAGEVGTDLQCAAHPGLFFAGRAAGSCNYVEAAALGLVAGSNAAGRSRDEECVLLTSDFELVGKLCEAVAGQPERPVTIRITGPGC